jgi:hypothetical protein
MFNHNKIVFVAYNSFHLIAVTSIAFRIVILGTGIAGAIFRNEKPDTLLAHFPASSLGFFR